MKASLPGLEMDWASCEAQCDKISGHAQEMVSRQCMPELSARGTLCGTGLTHTFGWKRKCSKLMSKCSRPRKHAELRLTEHFHKGPLIQKEPKQESEHKVPHVFLNQRRGATSLLIFKGRRTCSAIWEAKLPDMSFPPVVPWDT
eukprot:1158740-Pelagomonas_calceolata.AAC.5